MKTITTGTEITFTKTSDKFTLTQTETGFDVRQIKLSKNIPHEPYSFQELLDLYKQGHISIQGFEEGDNALVESIITNYIHGEQIGILNAEKTALSSAIQELKLTIASLDEQKSALDTINNELRGDNDELTSANKALSEKNKEFSQEILGLKSKIVSLNTTIEAMEEKE